METEKERLQAIIKWAGLNVNQFAKEIGFHRAMVLYKPLNGTGHISIETCRSIKERFPQVSIGWLLFGERTMLLSENDNKSIDALRTELEEAKQMLKICLESNLNLSHILTPK